MSMNTRSELEEERRLFYVALTRAKQRAFLSTQSLDTDGETYRL